MNVSLPLPPIAVKFPIPSQAPQVELTVFEVKESVFSACIVMDCSKLQPEASVINTLLDPTHKLVTLFIVLPLFHK